MQTLWMDWSNSQLVNQSIGQLVNQSIGQLVNQSIGYWVNRSGLVTEQLIDQATHH
jgi:hypothetical protein